MLCIGGVEVSQAAYLFVRAEHDRAFRRFEVEPNDVDRLLDQLGSVENLNERTGRRTSLGDVVMRRHSGGSQAAARMFCPNSRLRRNSMKRGLRNRHISSEAVPAM